MSGVAVSPTAAESAREHIVAQIITSLRSEGGFVNISVFSALIRMKYQWWGGSVSGTDTSGTEKTYQGE